MKSKKLIMPAIVIAVMAIAGTIYATGASASFGRNHEEMASTLAEKLGVEESKVTEAMDTMREDRQADRVKDVSENLDKAVTDGVITTDQKQAILDKQATLRAERQQHRTEMEQWYKDNGIDEEKVHDYIGRGNGMGGRGMHQGE